MSAVAPARGRTAEPLATVACSSCSTEYELSARTVRRALSEGRVPRCDRCMYGVKVEVTDDLRRYWLDRYGQPEIDQLAAALFGAKLAEDERQFAPGVEGALRRAERASPADLEPGPALGRPGRRRGLEQQPR
jgi:hypothetical protein